MNGLQRMSVVKGVHFDYRYAPKEDIEPHCIYMVNRFASIQTVPGSRSRHHFVALNVNKL